jgi:D-amino-acid oxidase
MRAVIVGCGVSGLTTGIRWLEAGGEREAEIWGRELPPHTTSNIAAALWFPYKAYPYERVLEWGTRTLEVFYDLAAEHVAGVNIQDAKEFSSEPPPEPWWRSCVRQFRYLQPEECPPGYKGGYLFETAVVEMGPYLEYLRKRFEGLGGRILEREIAALDEATAEAPVVFNCTGLGSYTLLDDHEMFPIRGQIMRVGLPRDNTVLMDDREDEDTVFAYIVPRSNDCVIGGTARAGDWSLEPDAGTAIRILERCSRLSPEVPELPVLEHVVGLRPGRSAVRLEAEHLHDGAVVVHNYGHSGAGVTLSWGCAEEALGLAGETSRRS